MAQPCIPGSGHLCLCRACLLFHLAEGTIVTRWRWCGQPHISWDDFPEQRPCSEETIWCWSAVLGVSGILKEHTWLCCLHCDPRGVALWGWPTSPLTHGCAVPIDPPCSVGLVSHGTSQGGGNQKDGARTLTDNLEPYLFTRKLIVSCFSFCVKVSSCLSPAISFIFVLCPGFYYL